MWSRSQGVPHPPPHPDIIRLSLTLGTLTVPGPQPFHSLCPRDWEGSREEDPTVIPVPGARVKGGQALLQTVLLQLPTLGPGLEVKWTLFPGSLAQ